MTTLSEYSHAVVSTGNAQFIEEIVIPFCTELEEVLPPHYGKEVPEPLKIAPNANASNHYLAVGLLGFTIFVSSRLTGKVLDDVYTTLIQPRLKPLLEKVAEKLAKKKGKQSFNMSLWYDEFNALVSVTITGDSYDDIIKQLHLLPVVHANAITWIGINGVPKPIHHYKVENGQVNATPILADHVQQVLG